MKTLAAVLFASLVLFGCQNESKLDGVGSAAAASEATSRVASNAELEARVKKLEEDNAKYHELLEFLQHAYDQQKAQQAAQERDQPAPDAIFAVNIDEDVKGGQVEGPNSACVTVVEAWDFA